MKKVLLNLVELADQLDNIGNVKIANEIDIVLKDVNSGKLLSQAVYSNDPDDPLNSAMLYIDRAASHLRDAEDNILQASTMISVDSWDDLRFILSGTRKQLEKWLDDSGQTDLKVLEANLNKTAVVRKLDGKWCVLSERGKKLGCYTTKKEAQKRLQQIEFFKHNK